MTRDPLVSIIVPMFNAENTIGETIRSVQEQRYHNWEMLIADNCSTDNSRGLVRGYIENDNRIRLIEADYNSGGPARPRNMSIKNSKGKYLAFLDADDLWLPDKLMKEVAYLENNNEYFLVYSKCFIKKNGKIVRQSPKKMYSGNVFNRLYLEFNFISCNTVMMLNQQGPGQYLFSEDKKFVCVEDYVLWLSIAKKHKIGFIDEPLAIYVLHGSNLSSGVFKTLKRIKIVMDEFAIFVPKGILIAKYFYFYCRCFEVGFKQILKQVVTRFGKK